MFNIFKLGSEKKIWPEYQMKTFKFRKIFFFSQAAILQQR